MTKHLIDLGHKRIAYFTGPPVSPSAQERYEGYRRALRESDIEMDDRLVFNAGSTIEEGEKAALQMLNENPKATAVQAVNDLVAIGVGGCLVESRREHSRADFRGGLWKYSRERIFSRAADDRAPAETSPGLCRDGIDAVAPSRRTAARANGCARKLLRARALRRPAQ